MKLILTDKNNRLYFLILQFAVFFVFLGRAWQHWFFEAPFREMLWDEARMSWLMANVFGVAWDDWVSNPVYDTGITSFIDGLGVFYLLCAFSVFLLFKYPRFSRFVLITGAVSLVMLAGLYYKQKLYHSGQFFEHTLQFTGPVVLVWLTIKEELTPRLVFVLKMAIALTFISHGMYAVGHYPRPALFIEMCFNILNISEDQTVALLITAGILDVIISVMIFLPYRKAVMIGLLYATLWGLLTAIARPWAFFHFEFWQESLHRWGFEAMFRLIHGLGPLVLFLYYWNMGTRRQNAVLQNTN